jgi:hypothetical protein
MMTLPPVVDSSGDLETHKTGRIKNATIVWRIEGMFRQGMRPAAIAIILGEDASSVCESLFNSKLLDWDENKQQYFGTWYFGGKPC